METETKTDNRTKWPELGTVCATCGVGDLFREDCSRFGEFCKQCLSRHSVGDWGDLSEEDRDANDLALVSGSRILSSYQFQGRKVWIITEARGDDGRRAYTTILFPEEY